jgi:nucleolar protein 15
MKQQLSEDVTINKRIRDTKIDNQSTEVKIKSVEGKKKTKVFHDSCVMYVGHIPHGFYEKQIYKFFRQFGKVLKVKLFRSSKTNRSKGYAFVKFESPEVTTEAANTMNGYFLQERQLKCEVVPIDHQHEGMFLPPKKLNKNSKNEINDELDDSYTQDDNENQIKEPTEKQIRILTRKQKKLIELGIHYSIADVHRSNPSIEKVL